MDMYNIENTEYLEYVKSLCLAGIPIPFYNTFLHHIKVKDIFVMSEDIYNSLVRPFRLNSDVLFGKTENGNKRFLLDILASDKDGVQLGKCLEILKIIFNTENIEINDMKNDDLQGYHKEIVVNNTLWLDKYKFEQLSEIILKMCYLRKVTEEDVNDNSKEKKLTYEQIMNIKDKRERDYQLAIYNKNKSEEKKQSKALSLYSVFNYICHASGVIDYEKPLNFNIYQFYNTYKILRESEKYKYDMRLVSSGMVSDIKKMDTRWFNERIIDE